MTLPSRRGVAAAAGAALFIPTLLTAPAAAVTCSPMTSQRLTSEPGGTGKRVVFVYVVPSGSPDERLDVPSACSDGTFRPSIIGLTYRDISLWMAKQLATTSGSRRLIPLTSVYRHPSTGGTRSLVTALYLPSPESYATWNCRSPSEKLSAIRSLLAVRGALKTNSIYAAILSARQTCSSVSTAGAGYLGTAGTTYGVAYVLRWFWSGGTSYVPARFGCANYSADAVMAHEIFHVLGGVPVAAAASDGAGHIRTEHDVLEAMLDGPFVATDGAARLFLDTGADDYRGTILSKGWDTTGYATSTAYRMC